MEHIGYECEFEALGQKWKAARRTRRVLMAHLDWARPQVPDPILEALKVIDQATRVDAGIMRDLLKGDHAEEAKALEEKRPPCLLSDKYTTTADVILKAAIESKRVFKDLNSPEVTSLANSMKGISHLFLLLLTPNHPGITQEQVDDILDDLSDARIAEIIKTVTGAGKPKPKNDAAPAA